MTDVRELNDRFQTSGLKFLRGPAGLLRAAVQTELCSAEFYLQGAHITAWQPTECRPVLWMSQQSQFEQGKPIRGGIPICCPWFGPHPSDANRPAHGTARTQEWSVLSAELTRDNALRVFLQTNVDDFQLRYAVEFGSTLRLSMQVMLWPAATSPAICELAMHTYFAVSDVRQIEISGLEHRRYIDKMDAAKEKQPTGTGIRFHEETDRVYIDTEDACVLHDASWNRKITVSKTGSRSTVIWNPWIAKSQRMPDFGDYEWPEMVCIESANVGPNRMDIEPGGVSELSVEISVS